MLGAFISPFIVGFFGLFDPPYAPCGIGCQPALSSICPACPWIGQAVSPVPDDGCGLFYSMDAALNRVLPCLYCCKKSKASPTEEVKWKWQLHPETDEVSLYGTWSEKIPTG